MGGGAGDPTADGFRLDMRLITTRVKDAGGTFFGHALDDAGEDE